MDEATEQQQEPPCPECYSTRGFTRVGKYRSQCNDCNALLQNAEINRENQEPQ